MQAYLIHPQWFEIIAFITLYTDTLKAADHFNNNNKKE